MTPFLFIIEIQQSRSAVTCIIIVFKELKQNS